MESASALADELGTLGTSDPDEVPDQADFYILCVPDAALGSVINKFQAHRGIWLHTAGAMSMDLFKDIHSHYGVLYPLQTLSKNQPVNLEHTPFLVEGSSQKVRDSIIDLAGLLTSNIQDVSSEARRVIHLAAVFASNFTNHMVHLGQHILNERGLDQKLLDPILEETLRKILAIGAKDAQTGPALRNDLETMQKHVELLKHHPEWEKLYTFISRDIGRSRDKQDLK